MTLSPGVIEKLEKPLDPKRVKKREGSGGRSLSYLEGHDVIRTANQVFGVGEWSYTVADLTFLGEEPVTSKYDKSGFRVAYRATVEVHVNDQRFSDVGYGDAMEYTGSKLTPHELASKEAVTDALKRALKNFGDQFGLVLYDKDAPEHNGRNGSTAQPARADGRGGSGAVTAPTPSGPPAPQTSDGWTWPFGKNKGKTLAETDDGYLTWFLENSDKEDIKERVRAFRDSVADFQGADDDIPFMPTIDGLGN